jgi:hypothetical protein
MTSSFSVLERYLISGSALSSLSGIFPTTATIAASTLFLSPSLSAFSRRTNKSCNCSGSAIEPRVFIASAFSFLLSAEAAT